MLLKVATAGQAFPLQWLLKGNVVYMAALHQQSSIPSMQYKEGQLEFNLTYAAHTEQLYVLAHSKGKVSRWGTTLYGTHMTVIVFM